MAEYVGFKIDFSVEFSRDNCQILSRHIRKAVRENWDAYHDPLSLPIRDDAAIFVDDLMEQVESERMQQMETDRGTLLITRSWIGFVFGPLSRYLGLLTIVRNYDGNLSAWVSVCTSEMTRGDADRLKLREECEPGFGDPRMLSWPGDEDGFYDRDNFLDLLDDYYAENERRYEVCYRDAHQVWDISAACLRHIVDRLTAVLPVAHVRLDPELQPGGKMLRFGQ